MIINRKLEMTPNNQNPRRLAAVALDFKLAAYFRFNSLRKAQRYLPASW